MASGGQTLVTEDILRNEFHFPPFKNLVADYELDFRYYKIKNGLLDQWCSWCFLGEITDDRLSQFVRNLVIVKDRDGRSNINIAFYHDTGSGGFDFTTLKKGHTICVTHGMKHQFLDGSVGLRIEELDTVKVIPCAMNDLFEISSFYPMRQDICWECEKEASSTAESGAALKRCAACHIALYCSKECQRKDWKERHRRWCRALPEFVKMTKIDYSKYDGFPTAGQYW